MSASDTFVIAGGGLAGAKAAEALREQGFDGRIVLAAEEDIRPYERPPLSKDYLQGKAERDTIFVHSPDWYDASRVELLLGTTVTGIDRGRREVTLSGGGHLGYGKLLLATGSIPRRLRCRARTPAACYTCAGSKTATGSGTPSLPAPGCSSSAPGGSAWRWPRRHGWPGSR